MPQTNIVFWFFIIVALVFVWFLLSFSFKGIGKWLIDLFNDAKEQIQNEEEDKEE